MFVMMVTPELAPVAKVGGLADVVFGLARELQARGNAVEVILPKYDSLRHDHIWGFSKAYEHLRVPWFNGTIETTVWSGSVHGVKCFFIDPHSNDNFFNRRTIYGHNDDLIRFAFFCRAALEFMLKTGKHPEILHCHDWQTALTPVLLYEIYKHLGMTHSRVCFTIHNFRHQGATGDIVLRATGLNRPEYYFAYDRLRDNQNPRALNLTKGGIVYSNFTTTVSPRHAWEAKDGGQAHGLEPTLHAHHHKFGGVLNGLDYEVFNPESDPHIPAHFNTQTIEKKYDNKRALRQRLLLADNERPIIAFIGRLDPQKGLDLVRHAIFYSLANRAQFVLLGESPDHSINEHFWGLKRQFNDVPDCHLEIGYNEELAHLIYAGADVMLVPSRFEPCGLTQLISMRYGTVPCVRSVGGLVDTVFDKDHSSRPLHERNGYVFEHPDNAGLESALRRAISCFYDFPDHFRELMLNGMRADYSWKEPAKHYLNIYDHIRDK
jgi:starch synthase